MPQNRPNRAPTYPQWEPRYGSMMSNREPANLDAARGNAGPDKVHPAVDFEIDVNRVVWDPEYRGEVLAELRRRSHVDGSKSSRDGRRPAKKDNRKAS